MHYCVIRVLWSNCCKYFFPFESHLHQMKCFELTQFPFPAASLWTITFKNKTVRDVFLDRGEKMPKKMPLHFTQEKIFGSPWSQNRLPTGLQDVSALERGSAKCCLGIGGACKLHRPMYKSNADDQCGEVAQVDDGDVGDVDDEDDKDNDDKERALWGGGGGGDDPGLRRQWQGGGRGWQTKE